ncbi:fimbrial protein [Halobacteriovorax sp.]|uniref:fimbrial protein n=1 Tax=Halobacteriovorax sp. TaxID=2020862 RepID=UPI003568C9EC
MKKILLASTTLALLSVPSFAATQGTLLLQGEIDQVLSLTVSAETGVNDSLDLVAGESATKVAAVSEQSNSNTGYKIFLKTQNAGLLKNGELDSVAYSLTYDGDAVSSLSTNNVEVKSVSTGGVYSHDSDVDITLTGSGSAAALTQGTYSDTVTFTIQAN